MGFSIYDKFYDRTMKDDLQEMQQGSLQKGQHDNGSMAAGRLQIRYCKSIVKLDDRIKCRIVSSTGEKVSSIEISSFVTKSNIEYWVSTKKYRYRTALFPMSFFCV
ncbi:hypothetical protein L596_029909 [Steinernema carpocapsae]|uniref:Uncharacterized protein n=1 Tax=Steinernema carpocapsae TaxID=34508 RepID=A0A4U5LR70_STECR|nr:hypothetical protein L596_029909 [Steinernema carpocapsae]